MRNIIKHYLRKSGYEIRKYTDNSEHQNLLKLLRHFKIRTVLDVGANVGQYSTRLRTLGYDQEIISFEPLPSAVETLKKISARDPKWKVLQLALGEQKERKTLHVSANSYSSSFLEMSEMLLDVAPQATYVDAVEVQVDILDSVLEIGEIATPIFLKIDSQGFEIPVLKGAQKMIAEKNIIGLQLEMSLTPLYENEPLYNEVMRFVEELGFTLYSIDPGLTDQKSGRMLQVDGIFFLNE
ncbi:MAG: FkbM family methyltransferase [Saprospiraceae bacterium]|nr:FkbM family methyltransferase [Saprospiraceae bacterium]